jgi:hypothetical protein
MGVETAADRAVFVDPQGFGVTASYRIADSDTRFPVNGIFDLEYFAVDVGAQAAVEDQRPRFTCRQDDLPELRAHGDDLTIPAGPWGQGGLYLVQEIHPDGTGMTVLVLEKQS